MNIFQKYFSPAPHIQRLSPDEIRRQYPRYRWRILESTFIGYATFYLVRNNLSIVSKDIEGALHYDHSEVGTILALTAITYGLGKLLMGSLSDRSNPRRFMPWGLILTALCNFMFSGVSNYHVHMFLWAMNGLFQGMGWAPCGRSLGHWFSVRERGKYFAVWNIAHNVGGGLIGIIAAYSAGRWGWRSAFYVPGILSLMCAVYLFWRLRDTPQSVGLPSIEEYKNDYTSYEKLHGTPENELTTKELFINHILLNRYLWLFAFANFFVYIVRYSMLDWGPVYLREAKNATLDDGGIAVFLIEFGGIPSTLLVGWLSDKVGGRRGMVSLLCMIPILIAFAVIRFNPPGRLWLDMTMLVIIGFFVYPPVMLLGVAALDLTSKKAVGTAAGFVGLFGYVGRTVQAKGLGWMAKYFSDKYDAMVAWNIVIHTILLCTLLSIILLAFTWKIKPRA